MTKKATIPAERLVINKRRFSMLSPTLVRMEYAPDGRFDERRSLAAYEVQKPLPFVRRSSEEGWDVLDTGFMQIRTTADGSAFNRLNLELRWTDGKLMQFWRPGDHDHQNLGGTLRSLDRYGGESSALDGVHVAGEESPDFSGTSWPAWFQCEVDPLYTGLHPAPPEQFNRGHWLHEVKKPRNEGRYLERTFNWYKESRRFCPGVVSASGYFLLNDSLCAVLDDDDFPVERETPGYQDWYFFAYGADYKQALRDFRLLSGPAPLPPHRSLGVIFSRWPAFTETEVDTMARDFRANGYPLSTLVMDMEWHKEGWGHWEFNPDLIPDPAKFFERCHAYGLDVVFNDHPLDVRDDDCHFDAYVRQAGPDVQVRTRDYNGKTLKMAKVDICDKRQNRAFREVCHTAILQQGLDYWWNDGSRGQMAATCGQLVCNKTFFEESARDGRRGMLLARWGGLGSHRYGGFFTGDANSDWDVLKLQVEFNIRTGQVGFSNVSHDIGGFMLPPRLLAENADGVKIIDPVRYVRWLQFGVFGPLLRFHSAPGCGSRLPYDYDSETGGACRRWLRVRHSLLPYIYTANREHYESGIPLVRGLYLDQPADPACYRFDQYRFGPDMLVAPVLSPSGERTIYLPPGRWWAFERAESVEGGREFTRTAGLSEVPVYVRAGSVIPRQSPDGDVHAAHVSPLILDVYAGGSGEGWLYEDDGVSPGYQRGAFCKTRLTLEEAPGTLTLRCAVAEGHPLGASRAVTVWISAVGQPEQAVLDTGATLTVTPADAPGRWKVEIPEVPAAGWALTLMLK